MLQRYFSLLLLTFFFLSACQNSEQTGEGSDTAMSVERQKEKSPSQIKSLKEIQKRQEIKTREKMKKAQEDEKAMESEMSIERREALKIDKQKSSKLSKENRIEAGKLSTKERILSNLRKNKKTQREEKRVGPSKDFMLGIRSLYDIDLEPLKLGKKAVTGYERFGKAEIVENHYAYVSPNKTWGGPFMLKKGKETEHLVLQEVNVYEAILKSKEMRGDSKPDVKITEIQFASAEMAEEGMSKVKIISEAIFEYPKHINTFWQDEERIYIIETRSASFEDVYDTAHKVFYHTVTSTK